MGILDQAKQYGLAMSQQAQEQAPSYVENAYDYLGIESPSEQKRKIIDADTLGGGRLQGIDAPESFDSEKARKITEQSGLSLAQQKELALGSKQVLEDYLKANPAIQLQETGVDKYGRILLYNEQLNEALVRSGQYVPTDRYNQKLQSLYRATQEKVRRLDPAKADAMDAQREYNIEPQDPGMWESLKRIPSAAMSGTQQLVAGLGDAVLDMLPGESTYFEKAKSAEAADKNWGYDRREQQFAGQEAVYKWKKGDELGAIAEGVSVAPEVLGGSAPDIAMMSIPGTGLVKAGSLMLGAARSAKVAGAIAESKALANTAKVLNDNAGFGAYVATRSNNDIEEWTKNNNGVEPDVMKRAEIVALNTLSSATDKIVFKDIISSKGTASKAIKALKDTAEILPDTAVVKIAGTVAKAGLDMGEEAAQEYFQTWSEILSTKLGTTKYGSLENIINNTELQDEALAGALLGAGAGGMMSVGGSAGNAVVEEYKGTESYKAKVETAKTEAEKRQAAQTMYTNVKNNVYEDIVSEYNDIINNEVNADEKTVRYATEAKITLAEKMSTTEYDAENVKLGSKQSALDLIEDIVLYAKEPANETTQSKLRTIARNHGIEEQELNEALAQRRDVTNVEADAVWGTRGYKTYGKLLRQMQEQGNEAGVSTMLGKIEKYSATQVAKRDAMQQGLDKLQDTLNAVNSDHTRTLKANKVYKLDSGWEVNVIKDENGKYTIQEASKTPLVKANENLAGMSKELMKYKAIVEGNAESEVKEAKVAEVETKEVPPEVTEQDLMDLQEYEESLKEYPSTKSRSEAVKDNAKPKEVNLDTEEKVVKEDSNAKKARRKAQIVKVREELESSKADDFIEDVLQTSISRVSDKIQEGAGEENTQTGQERAIHKMVKNKPRPTNLLSMKKVEAISGEMSKLAKNTGKLLSSILKHPDELKGTKEENISNMLANNPSVGLLYQEVREKELDEMGVAYEKVVGKAMHPNVLAAIGLAVEEYIGMNAKSISNKFLDEDIEDMMANGKSVSELSRDEKTYLKEAGNYLKNVAADMGKTILKTLDMVPETAVGEDNYAKLVSDLGHMATQLMEERGLVEIREDDLAAHNKIVGYHENVPEGSKVYFVKITEKGKDYISSARDTYEELSGQIGMESDYVREPKSAPIKTTDRTVRNNDELTVQSDKVKDVMDHLRSEKYVKLKSVTDWVYNNKELAKKYMGYVYEAEMEDMAMYSRESAEAKNRAIEESIQKLLDNDMDEMYFDWFYTKNGRYMVDSTTINPQGDKLHRYAVVNSLHEQELDWNSPKDRMLYKIAVAQAMGMSIEKELPEAIEAYADEVMAKDPDKLMKELESGEIEVEHLGHYLQAVESLRNWKNRENGKWRSNLSAEFDDTTSAYGIGFLQFPLVNNLYVMMEKTGFFLGKRASEVDSMNIERKSPGFLDIYQTSAANMAGKKYVAKSNNPVETAVYAMLPVVLKGQPVTKAMRELFKNPTMTVGYGRSLVAIKESIGVELVNQILDNIVASQNPKSKMEQADRGNANLLLEAILEKSKKYEGTMEEKKKALITELKTKKVMSVENQLQKLISNTYGKDITESLKSTFGKMMAATKLINSSFVRMFEEFNKKYQEKLKELGGQPTVQQKLAIVKSLKNTFPMIKGPLSDKEYDTYIAIYDKSTESPRSTVSSLWMKAKKRAVLGKVRKYEAAISSGGVVPIHYLDGASMGMTLLEVKGILSIHDAIIPPLKNAMEAVQAKNKNTWEVNKNYSIVQEVVNAMERIVGKNDLDMKALYELNGRVQKAREEIFSQEVAVVHCAAMPGSAYKAKAKATVMMDERVHKILKDMSDKDTNAIMAIINKFKEC